MKIFTLFVFMILLLSSCGEPTYDDKSGPAASAVSIQEMRAVCDPFEKRQLRKSLRHSLGMGMIKGKGEALADLHGKSAKEIIAYMLTPDEINKTISEQTNEVMGICKELLAPAISKGQKVPTKEELKKQFITKCKDKYGKLEEEELIGVFEMYATIHTGSISYEEVAVEITYKGKKTGVYTYNGPRLNGGVKEFAQSHQEMIDLAPQHLFFLLGKTNNRQFAKDILKLNGKDIREIIDYYFSIEEQKGFLHLESKSVLGGIYDRAKIGKKESWNHEWGATGNLWKKRIMPLWLESNKQEFALSSDYPLICHREYAFEGEMSVIFGDRHVEVLKIPKDSSAEDIREICRQR